MLKVHIGLNLASQMKQLHWSYTDIILDKTKLWQEILCEIGLPLLHLILFQISAHEYLQSRQECFYYTKLWKAQVSRRQTGPGREPSGWAFLLEWAMQPGWGFLLGRAMPPGWAFLLGWAMPPGWAFLLGWGCSQASHSCWDEDTAGIPTQLRTPAWSTAGPAQRMALSTARQCQSHHLKQTAEVSCTKPEMPLPLGLSPRGAGAALLWLSLGKLLKAGCTCVQAAGDGSVPAGKRAAGHQRASLLGFSDSQI